MENKEENSKARKLGVPKYKSQMEIMVLILPGRLVLVGGELFGRVFQPSRKLW